MGAAEPIVDENGGCGAAAEQNVLLSLGQFRPRTADSRSIGVLWSQLSEKTGVAAGRDVLQNAWFSWFSAAAERNVSQNTLFSVAAKRNVLQNILFSLAAERKRLTKYAVLGRCGAKGPAIYVVLGRCGVKFLAM